MVIVKMLKLSESLKILENQRGGLQIIAYLREKKEGNLSDFIINLRIPSSSVSRAINALKDLGLITERNIKGSNVRIFSLDEKGMKIADHIEKINEILGE